VGWLSRCATISNIGLYENARTGSRMPKLVLWGLFFGVIAVVMKLALLIVAAFAIALVFAWMLSRRLSGGLTGDVYGALIVITEVGLLKTVSIFPALLR
jgi:cobalamin synthase